MKQKIFVILALVGALILSSCSTTRVLQDGEYRLAQNRIKIENDKEFNANQLTKYLKQNESIGWSPFMCVYNWSTGKGTGWDRFVEKIGKAPVVYDADLVDSSIDNLENHLKYLGYYGSTVEPKISVNKKKVTVEYLVTLGKRFPIKEISYVMPKRGEFPQTFMTDTSKVTIKKGSYLSEMALEKESVRAGSAMRNLGYYDFSKNNFFFEADTITYPGYALLEMQVNEFTRNETSRNAEPIRKFHIGDVTLTYPKTLKINENIIRDLNTILPGEVYSESEVNKTYSRLSGLKVFSSVNIEMSQKDTNTVDCNISLSPSKLQGFKVNLEASTNSSGLLGVSPQLSYYHKNIFRGGEWLNLSLMGDLQFKFNDNVRSNEFGVSAGLSFPRFFPLSYKNFKGAIPRTEANLSYNYQSRPEYTRNIISTSLGYSGNSSDRFYYQLYPLQLSIVRLNNMDDNFFASLADDPYLWNAFIDHFDLGSRGILYYTTDSSAIPKDTYFYTRFQLDLSGNLLSLFNPLMKTEYDSRIIWGIPYSQYVKTELSLGKTWFWGNNNGQSLASRLYVGVGKAYGNSYSLPFEKNFYAGGANSLRGWQAKTVGPGGSEMLDIFIIPSQNGDMKLEANLEYRFNMFWKVEGAAFVDVGNVWMMRTKIDKEAGYDDPSIFGWKKLGETIAANWGVGVRLNLDFILLRLDLGMRLHDPAKEQKWVNPGKWLNSDNCALHFGVGYPF